MALTIAQAGSSFSTGSTGTLFVSNVEAVIGDMLVVVVAADNNGTNGASSLSSVTDSEGNIYTQRTVVLQDPGAAAAGATLGIYTAAITTELSFATVTINFSPNTALKAAVIYRVSPSAGTVEYRTAGAGSNGLTASPTITATSVASGDTIIGGLAAETDDGITADSDTSNGNWSTQYSALADAGADAATMVVAAQYKTTTATANQTYNPTVTGGVARDTAINYILIYEQSTATVLTVSNATVSLAPQNVVLQLDLRLPVSQASISLTGQTVDLSRAVVLPATNAAITFSPQSVTLNRLVSEQVTNAAITLSPQTVVLNRLISESVTQASISLVPQDVTLSIIEGDRTVPVSVTTVSFAGQTIDGIRLVPLLVDAASVIFGPQSVSTIAPVTVVATHASIGFTPQSVTLTVNVVAAVSHAAVSFAGQSVTTEQKSPVEAAALAFSPQAVDLSKLHPVVVTSSTVTFAPQAVGLNRLVPVAVTHVAMSFSGQGIALDYSGSVTVSVDGSAAWMRNAFLSKRKSLML